MTVISIEDIQLYNDSYGFASASDGLLFHFICNDSSKLEKI